MDHNAPQKLKRLSSILGPDGPIPVSRSTWWAGVKSGRFPAPVKLGPRTTAWRVEDIEKLNEFGVGSSANTDAGKRIAPETKSKG
jgi:hypothetical protein